MLKKTIFPILVLTLCVFISSHVLHQTSYIQQNHYVALAQAFLNGRLNIENPTQYSAQGDIALFNDKYYVYFGPAPAIILIPFVTIFKNQVSQQILGLIFLVIDFILLYRIANKFGLKPSDSIWMSIFFVFGTVFIFLTLINVTAYQVQVIGTSFFILALYEFFHKRNWIIIGILLTLAGSTRFTLYLTAIFFILIILYSKIPKKLKLQNLTILIIPIMISIIIIGDYNYYRFGSFFDTGYSYNASWSEDLKKAASVGIFSPQHITGNLFFLLFKGPEAVRANADNFVLKFPYLSAHPWGMGIFFTSPLFLYIFLAKFKEKQNLFASITILVMLIPILSYYGIGVFQYGYRYALDFYPFLFLLLLSVFRKRLPTFAKILIVYGAIFNFYLMMSIWGIYPFRV